MEKIGLNKIREKFLNFFESKAHMRLPSFSLVPEHDKSLLVINAGMAPLKPYFTGQATPPSRRVATCQKCLRTGDVDEVGKTARHNTFFEMLGNFSFGDYFKEEVIPWAWEFITKELEIPTDKLYVSIYLDDDEAYKIWRDKVGVSADRIFRMGKKDNFWELSLGPCGPCSEIYYDRGPRHGLDDFMASVSADEDRYIEFWNLVFTQFDKAEDGSYSDLQMKNIDTGMGLERISMIMQGVDSIFEIDTMKAIRDEVCAATGTIYGTSDKTDVSICIITDHARAITFMISDGILPSNEGRGYVLRRLLRRAVRHGKLLGINSKFLNRLVSVVIENYKNEYIELWEKRDYIFKLVEQEEQRFFETLDSGTELLRSHISRLKSTGQGVLNGTDIFKLHDTFGFPLELTKEILEEEGLTADEKGFSQEMEKQRSRARAAREDAGFTGGDESVFDGLGLSAVNFVGYDNHFAETSILYISCNNRLVETASEGDEVAIITNITPVYAESGGQKSDCAIIETDSGKIEITDCIKVSSGQFAHMGRVLRGEIRRGDKAKISIDSVKRLDTSRHHTATHLLHAALRKVLGEHVQQAGSLVTHDRLRFDFAHFAPISTGELAEIEAAVNRAILANLPVSAEEMPVAEAKSRGAIALFGEKYGETVRVIDIGGEAIELCGGTHLNSTAQIGSFKILSENGISAGVRRVEAVVGASALAHYGQVEARLAEISALLKTPAENLQNRITQLIAANKETERQLAKIRQLSANSNVDEILAAKEQIGSIFLASALLPDMDIDALRKLSDTLIDKIGQGAVILAGTFDGKANILARATADAVKSGIHCGNIVKAAATAAGGGGGGRPDMAQAGIKNADKAKAALEAACGIIRN